MSRNEFLIFTCSTIQSDQLFSNEPWNYVSLDPTGNNLERDIPALQQILEEENRLQPTRLSIIIGNTDPYYIYLQQFKNIPPEQRLYMWQKFIERWSMYRDRLENTLHPLFPEGQIRVLSWYTLEKETEQQYEISFEKEFERTYKNIDQFFVPEDFAWELRQLSQQFGLGKYFSSLEKPSDELLNDWVRRKFAEYAVQGKWLKQIFPEAVLIQNEKPTDLRSKMYQPLLTQQGASLPIAHWLGIDNQGYA